jgi:transcriptional regulator GlxA family with amidase domain
VRKAVEVMDADIVHNFKVKNLSLSIGISRSHLTSLFNAAFGLPPHQWLLRKRLDAARTLLTEGPRSITEIAFSCGFNSFQHFATAFRARFGLSPSAYRRKWSCTPATKAV